MIQVPTRTLGYIERNAQEFISIRRQIHQHPELAFEESRTSELVAGKLAQWGYEVQRGLGGTGVVGQLKRGEGGKRLGLRADMDALPIAGDDRPALRQRPAGHDARLRPRRPHRHAAGRGALPGAGRATSTAR